MTEKRNRRRDDPRLEQLVADVSALKADLKVVHDTVLSFRLARSAAKWLTVLVTALAASIGLAMSVKTAWDVFFFKRL